MNKLLLSALALASLSTITPSSARAGSSETRALVGGLIGGLIIGSSLNNNHHHVSVSHYPPPPPSCPPAAPSGYWRDVQTQVWVPGCWVSHHDSCGRKIRVYQQGYYTYRTDRVWVATGGSRHDNGDHHGHYRSDRNRYARR